MQGAGGIVKLLTNSPGGQVLFFAYRIKAAKGHRKVEEGTAVSC
jgi:hypothetical protein